MSTKAPKKNQKKSKKFISRLKSKQIKKKMIDKEISQIDIARALGVTQAYVSMVIHGRRRNKKVYEYIEKKLGVKVA